MFLIRFESWGGDVDYADLFNFNDFDMEESNVDIQVGYVNRFNAFLANLDTKHILNKDMVRREFRQLNRRVLHELNESDALGNDNYMANLDEEHIDNSRENVDMLNINRADTTHLTHENELSSKGPFFTRFV